MLHGDDFMNRQDANLLQTLMSRLIQIPFEIESYSQLPNLLILYRTFHLIMKIRQRIEILVILEKTRQDMTVSNFEKIPDRI